MELVAKRFNELSLDEYHELLKLRCAVFLVEQQSPYQEVDDADKEAIHLYFRNDEGALAAYARVLPCLLYTSSSPRTPLGTWAGWRAPIPSRRGSTGSPSASRRQTACAPSRTCLLYTSRCV